MVKKRNIFNIITIFAIVFLITCNGVGNISHGNTMSEDEFFDLFNLSHPSKWAVEEVNKAINMRIVPNHLVFKYKQSINRLDFSNIAIRAISYVYEEDISKIIENKGLKIGTPFTDTDDIYVNQAYALGIVNGVGNGKFNPYSEITREQAATLLNNIIHLFEYKLEDYKLTYNDINEISNYAIGGVNNVSSIKVMNGDGNKFNPKGNYTVEQSIVTLYRLINILKEDLNKEIFSSNEMAKIREINERLKKMEEPVDKVYLIEANTKEPYNVGKINEKLLYKGLDYINFAREMAGLPQVTLSDELNDYAQHGAFLLDITKQFTHYPSNTINLPENIFNKGYESCSSSNIGSGYRSLYKFNRACMDDSDISNIYELGHRRWLLSPQMGKVGMGLLGTTTNTYVFDKSNIYSNWDTIKWPSEGLFPKSEFNITTAWSISLGNNYKIDDTSIEVLLKRVNDGETWSLSNKSTKQGLEFFNVSKATYGNSGPCIVFRPNLDTYKTGDEFFVKITGITSSNTNINTSIEYYVKFF